MKVEVALPGKEGGLQEEPWEREKQETWQEMQPTCYIPVWKHSYKAR